MRKDLPHKKRQSWFLKAPVEYVMYENVEYDWVRSIKEKKKPIVIRYVNCELCIRYN